MNEGMQKLIDAVQKASPIVWQAAYRQVWIEFGELCFGVVFFLVVGMLFLRWVKVWRDPTDRPIGRFIGTALCALSIPCFLAACEYAINPTFAAIKELKGLL